MTTATIVTALGFTLGHTDDGGKFMHIVVAGNVLVTQRITTSEAANGETGNVRRTAYATADEAVAGAKKVAAARESNGYSLTSTPLRFPAAADEVEAEDGLSLMTTYTDARTT